jgi:hypothetical protein
VSWPRIVQVPLRMLVITLLLLPVDETLCLLGSLGHPGSLCTFGSLATHGSLQYIGSLTADGSLS